jgi:hypothetical protein
MRDEIALVERITADAPQEVLDCLVAEAATQQPNENERRQRD